MATDKTQRDNAMSVLNAMHRLVVVTQKIDKAFADDKIAEADYDRVVFIRNSLCLTANIWNEHLSGCVNKLYRGSSNQALALAPEHVAFYNERMPRSVRFAAKELAHLHIEHTECFVQGADDIVAALEVYAGNNVGVAGYLHQHQENIDDIPMLDMIGMGDMPRAADKTVSENFGTFLSSTVSKAANA
jgi:hypothetical protein